MARYGVTITVNTGKMPSNQTDFVWMATAVNFPTAAIDGGATSILNGGGNLRCYTDDTKSIQLPVEVVTFVTGGSPDIRVWGLSPALNVASTVYIEADTVATTQPAVSAPFGRNATWVNYEYASHDGLIDVTGNHTPTSSGTTLVSGPFGGTGGARNYNLDNSDNISVAGLSIDPPFTMSAYGSIDNDLPTRIIAVGNDLVTNQQVNLGTRFSGNRAVELETSPSGNVNITGTAGDRTEGEWRLYTARVTSATDRKAYLNGGTLSGVSTSSVVNSGLNKISLGRSADSTPFGGQPLDIAEPRFIFQALSDNYIQSERNNQSSPSTFWTVGAWEDQDTGGGVTVTGATPSFNYSSIAASIDLTGSIDIIGQTANYTYSAVNGVVDLTGDISIIGATASYNYQSINGAVDLTGEITVLGLTPNQSYSSVSGVIELGAAISIVGLTPNYNYQGIAGEVSLNGEILVSGETPSYSYSAIKGFVTTGEAQVIGTVTSSFASDVYSSGFKPSTITVNFKS